MRENEKLVWHDVLTNRAILTAANQPVRMAHPIHQNCRSAGGQN